MIDMNNLSNVFSMFSCSICQYEFSVLHENSSKKHRLWSSLCLKGKKCENENEFFTSEMLVQALK